MSIESFRLPDVGEGIAEAELVEWVVKVGDRVEVDQALVVVETDKSQVELPSPYAGTVAALHGDPGDRIRVGAVLVEITCPDVVLAPSIPAAGEQHAPRPALARGQTTPGTGAPVLASPYTRKIAAERGISLHDIVGTGPHGRVQLTDLPPDAGPAPSALGIALPADDLPTPGDGRRVPPAGRTMTQTRPDVVVPLRGLRRRIAESMTTSLAVPHILEFREVEATPLLAAHRVLKDELGRSGVRLSVLTLLMLATIRALKRHRQFNASYDVTTETLTQHGSIHLGMATATDDGLIVPVLHDADALTPRELAEAIDRAAERSRTRTAAPAELTGGTFTVTNFGSFGTWLGTPIIRPPEVGIAGFGRITDKVIPVRGKPKVRPVLPLVVATDHRFNDGAHLAAFVTDLAAALFEPALLLS